MSIVVRIFDIVIAEGLEAILRFGVAVMKRNAETVLELEFEKCLDFLQTGLFDVYKVVITTENLLMRRSPEGQFLPHSSDEG